MEPHWLRLKHQSFAGIIMCASVIDGVAVAAAGTTSWGLVALSTVIAGVLSLLADCLRLRPAGPFFYLFAFTASASIPFRGPLWEAAAAAAGSVAVVLLLGFAGRLRARRVDPHCNLREAPHAPWPKMLTHAGRYIAAIGLDATGGLVRAVHRTIGTYGGVLLTACLMTVSWSPLQLAVLLAALQFVGASS